jgi:hypothetical protein
LRVGAAPGLIERSVEHVAADAGALTNRRLDEAADKLAAASLDVIGLRLDELRLRCRVRRRDGHALTPFATSRHPGRGH